MWGDLVWFLDGSVDLDDRGGFINQTHIELATYILASQEEFRGFSMNLYSAQGRTTLGSAYTAFAYQTRVFLSHFRIKHATWARCANKSYDDPSFRCTSCALTW